MYADSRLDGELDREGDVKDRENAELDPDELSELAWEVELFEQPVVARIAIDRRIRAERRIDIFGAFRRSWNSGGGEGKRRISGRNRSGIRFSAVALTGIENKKAQREATQPVRRPRPGLGIEAVRPDQSRASIDLRQRSIQ